MRKLLLVFAIFLIGTGAGFSQLTNIANYNNAESGFTGPDSLRPYIDDQGVRCVWVANDLDQDGKPEILATDYTNNGRVHVYELNGDKLELVWTSPSEATLNGSGSTPRWVRSGDLDGDGKGEIIFPLYNTGKVEVYEWDGVNDNGYIQAIELPEDQFAAQGVGNFRMNREVASVYDFDGDGADELIMVNYDNSVYVLGISGDVPGFGGWQLEGGDPAEVTANGADFSGGSLWHSVPADINGDGQIEIVNHHWNFFGFWSIEPNGTNSYTYPDTTKSDYYVELRRNWNQDAVSYMGLQPADVDGDGKTEVAGIMYGADYDVALLSFNQGDDPLYSWDTTKYGVIGHNLWELAGNSAGSFWGIGAADLNGNGKEEILLGGSSGYDVVDMEYNGSGDVKDPNSYTNTIIYSGPENPVYASVDIYDSLGVMDTTKVDAPFISRMYAGCDINGNGKPEVAAAYQTVVDSVTYTYYSWDGSAKVKDSTVKVFNPNQINVRLLESGTATGIEAQDLKVVTPADYKLEQNYPNPFNPSTSIKFTLPVSKKISLTVYDILGNKVKTLINSKEYNEGSYNVTWDGTNEYGHHVSSGQYIYTLKYGNFSKSLKMTLLK